MKNKSLNLKTENSAVNKSFYATEEYLEKETTVERKMKALQPKIFGIPMVRYEYKGESKVYIPNAYLLMQFKIERNITWGDKSLFNREGEIGLVFDMNEPHAFFCDEKDILVRKKMDLKNCGGRLLPMQCSEDEMVEQAIQTVQRQVLLKTYKTMGNVTVLKIEKFYRPAWELSLEYKGRPFTKYAYLDEYGSSSERIKGLKARLEV